MSVQINIPDHILFEDEYIIVLDKPNGMMVEPDRNGHPNLLQQVQKYLRKSTSPGELVYAQHIHRLDRPVSGVILFAKQKKVLKNLSEQFADRKVKKYYRALTDIAPSIFKGKLENWLRKEKKKAMIVEEGTPYSEKVLLDYETIPLSENRFLWNIELHTGKFHQIRAQLSTLGCPIIGDHFYGSAIDYQPDSIALHAWKLVFTHPMTHLEICIEKNNQWKI
jgi:RluA family pseudouridine synthase